MQNLNIARLNDELDSRLYGSLGNRKAETELKNRCLKAVESGSIKNLFDAIEIRNADSIINLSAISVISNPAVTSTLASTGALDLVYLCINATQGYY